MSESVRREKTEITWLWLLAATFMLHLAEEYWAGVALAPSPAEVRGANLAPAQFLMLIALAGVLLSVGVVLARRFRFAEWLLVCLAAVALVNTLFHLAGAARIGGYNPGLASGVLVFAPFGAATLFRLRKSLRPSKYISALAVGVGINLVVLLIARGGRRFLGG